MHLLLLVILGVLSLAFIGACTTPFDGLRARTEDLSPLLHHRASWKDPWLNVIPRGTYPKGAGYVRSTFTIQRSEPSSDEETWNAIAAIDTGSNTTGACNVTYNQANVGMHEDTYKPESFGLVGPLVCQDDLVMYWESESFWESYFKALEKRNRKSVINRAGNVFRQYVPKAAANQSFAFIAGNVATQPAPASVNMAGLNAGNIPNSELTQEMLDATAIELMEEGADEGDTNGWITQGADGAQFPLYIGSWMSHRLLLNNSELRSDFNQSFQGWGDTNPVIKRLGASRIIKNFRHVINRFPARWTDCTMSNTTITVGGIATVFPRVNPGTSSNVNPLLRVPTWLPAAPGTGEKGTQVSVNPDWRDPALANYESCEVMNPNVMTEEILMPINSMPGMKLTPQNYFGEWTFVTGNDALLGFAGCAGISDPMHKQGRHFAEIRHAFKPVIPAYGRMILFKRCAASFDTLSCS